MMWRKIKCWFGVHAPDCIKEEDYGRKLVQRCLYCDRAIHRFENKNNTIRRIM